MKVECPACGHNFAPSRKGRWVTVGASAVRWLGTLVVVHEQTGDYVHLVDVAKARPDDTTANIGSFQRLKYWGLIERKRNEDTRKRTSGYWRPTSLGIQFIKDATTRIPRRVLVRDDTVIQVDSSLLVNVNDALKIPFDYAALVAELRRGV